MLGTAHSLSWDYRPDVPQGEAAERRVSWKEKPLGSLFTRYVLKQPVPNSFALPPPNQFKDEEALSISEKKGIDTEDISAVDNDNAPGPSAVADSVAAHPDPDVQLARRTSRLSTATGPLGPRRGSMSAGAAPDALPPPVPPPTPAHSTRGLPMDEEEGDAQSITPTLHGARRIVRVFRPLAAVITPVTITLAISLPIALIAPLKALFVDISDQGGPVYTGPDGRPPLAFMIDTGACPLLVPLLWLC